MRIPAVPLLLLVGASALVAGSEPAEHSFSRSRWIAARSHQMRFDGGVLPASAEAFRGLSYDAARPRRGVPPGPPNVRISKDILPPDLRSGAQPETETECFVVQ